VPGLGVERWAATGSVAGGALSRGNVEELGVGTPGQPTVMSGSAMIRGAVMALKKPSAATAGDD